MRCLDPTKFHWRATLAVAILVLGALGCGGSGAEQGDSTGPSDDSNAGAQQWVLSVVDSNTFSVPKEGSTRLRARLAHPEKGVRPDRVVEFEIPGETKSRLARHRATTDERGIASVEFRAGTSQETVTVRADHPKAEPVEMQVEVDERSPGDLTVAFDQPNAHSTKLETTRARLYPSNSFSCSVFEPLAAVDMGAETASAGAPTERVTFESLDPSTTYTVVARSQNRAGLPAAAGCKDGIEIPAGETARTRVELDYLPLDPAGTYQIRSTWDLSSFVANASPFGEKVQSILEVVSDPAGALFDQLAEEIEKRTNDLVAAAVENSSVAADIQSAINQRLRESGLPDRLRNLTSSLQRTIAGLEIQGRLQVSQRESGAEVTGTHVWEKAYVQPPANCDPNASGSCDRHEIALQSEVDGGLRSEWTGRVRAYNDLELDTHVIRVDAGDLVTQILEKILIPQMTDGAASTLDGAIEHWFDCPGLAADLASGNSLCISGVCVPESTIAGACTATLSRVLDAEALADRLLDVNVAFELEGSGQMTKRTDGPTVERITSGTFEGSIRTIGKRTSSPADAEWSATRK